MSPLATPQTSTTAWNLDPVHSLAEFKVKHRTISNVKGQFPKLRGALTRDESDLINSHVEAAIEAASIDVRDRQRDTHLKSADCFDVEKFPALSFKSAGVSTVRDGELAVEGNLIIHGLTRGGNTRVAVSASTSIHRKDFGLTSNAARETAGTLVGDEVTITRDVQFVKA
jgi:polyisoprenoid-binding protein YceI